VLAPDFLQSKSSLSNAYAVVDAAACSLSSRVNAMTHGPHCMKVIG
jgi:hypothetical protein